MTRTRAHTVQNEDSSTVVMPLTCQWMRRGPEEGGTLDLLQDAPTTPHSSSVMKTVATTSSQSSQRQRMRLPARTKTRTPQPQIHVE